MTPAIDLLSIGGDALATCEETILEPPVRTRMPGGVRGDRSDMLTEPYPNFSRLPSESGRG